MTVSTADFNLMNLLTGIPALTGWPADKVFLPEGFRKPLKHMDVLQERHGCV